VIIPKRFKIFGQTIEVEFHDNLVSKNDEVGHACYRENKIRLQGNTKSVPRPREQTEQGYLHEVVHIIFDQIGKDELRKDEGLVDLFANALHQILTTSEK
jgi:hypothetical protein